MGYAPSHMHRGTIAPALGGWQSWCLCQDTVPFYCPFYLVFEGMDKKTMARMVAAHLHLTVSSAPWLQGDSLDSDLCGVSVPSRRTRHFCVGWDSHDCGYALSRLLGSECQSWCCRRGRDGSTLPTCRIKRRRASWASQLFLRAYSAPLFHPCKKRCEARKKKDEALQLCLLQRTQAMAPLSSRQTLNNV